MIARFKQTRFLVLICLVCIFSIKSFGINEDDIIVGTHLKCTDELSRKLELNWWDIFPNQFFSHTMTDSILETEFNIEAFEEEVTNGNSYEYLSYLRYMFYHFEVLNSLASISLGKMDEETNRMVAEKKKQLRQKIIEILRVYSGQIVDPLLNFSDKENYIGDLIGITIFFQSNLEFLDPLASKISKGFLDSVISRLLHYASLLIEEEKTKSDRLHNDTFAIAKDGTFYTLHSDSKAMAKLGIRATHMQNIFRFSILNISKLKKNDFDKLVKIAERLILYRPLVFELAKKAIEQNLGLNISLPDLERILNGDSMPFPSQNYAYKLLRNLETAEKFLAEAKKKRD